MGPLGTLPMAASRLDSPENQKEKTNPRERQREREKITHHPPKNTKKIYLYTDIYIDIYIYIYIQIYIYEASQNLG